MSDPFVESGRLTPGGIPGVPGGRVTPPPTTEINLEKVVANLEMHAVDSSIVLDSSRSAPILSYDDERLNESNL